MLTPRQIVERPETFKLSEADWEPLTEEQSIVHVGDPVVQIQAKGESEVGGIIAKGSRESEGTLALPEVKPEDPST
jgi:hypothetical protein